MRIRTEFPRPTSTIANTFIPLADGTRLAARIWLPEDAEADPVPAILEYIPYRKDDGTAARDALMHPWWAGHGYANVRVDQRGSGDSDGIILDEYTEQEHDDALEVLDWLAAQPWCTGKVGIIGKSWGGFNGLQIAARRPPALAGVISRRLDRRPLRDRHPLHRRRAARRSRQAVLGVDDAGLQRAPAGPAASSATAGARCGSSGSTRRRRSSHEWVSHQRRDEYWKHGSVCEDYVGHRGAGVHGRRLAGRLHATPSSASSTGYGGQLQGPGGPWGHVYPHVGAARGPAIGFLQEALRFWDHAQGRCDNGMLTRAGGARVDSGVGPTRATRARRAAGPLGRGARMAAGRPPRAGDAAPARRRRPGRATPAAAASCRPRLQHTGWTPARGRAGAFEGDDPPDQRAEDGRSLCFTSAPLPERTEMLGLPRGAADAGLRPAAGARRRARLRRLARRRVAARQPRLPQPHPPRLARAPGAARARPRVRGARSG